MAPFISANAYSKLKGLNQKTIEEAIKRGRITAHRRGKLWQIDPAVADVEWVRNAQSVDSFRHNPEILNQSSTEGGVPDYLRSRAVKEAYQARMSRLEYEIKSGKMIDGDKAKEDGFSFARQIRNAFQDIPSRIAAEIGSKKNTHDIEQYLRTEIDQVLLALSKYESPAL